MLYEVITLTQNNDLIYVPAQGSNVVSVFNRETLELVQEITIPGVHGAFMSRITSYNVCYTKLLRFAGFFVILAHNFPRLAKQLLNLIDAGLTGSTLGMERVDLPPLHDSYNFV